MDEGVYNHLEWVTATVKFPSGNNKSIFEFEFQSKNKHKFKR